MKTDEPKIHTTIYLTRKQLDGVGLAAAFQGSTKAQILRHAVDSWLRERGYLQEKPDEPPPQHLVPNRLT